MNTAIILAAGQGRRFGRLKQFIILKGKPVVYYSLFKFSRSPCVDNIIVVTLKSKISYLNKLIKKYNFSKISNVVIGGETRQDSVANALKLILSKGYVAIHDAARPNFSERFIQVGFKLVKKFKAIIPVIPITDTIKMINHNEVIQTIDRNSLYYVQTPQFFELDLIKKAYNFAAQQKYNTTDDASLIEKLGLKVYILKGTKSNIKLTDYEDFILLKKII